MKIYELINQLLECPAGADVEIIVSIGDGYENIVTTDIFPCVDGTIYVDGNIPSKIKRKK